MMRLRTFYSTIVLSDIHLGTSHSKTTEVTNFLKSVNCRRLILNGDIIDGAQRGYPQMAGTPYGLFQSNYENDGKTRYGGYLCAGQPR